MGSAALAMCSNFFAESTQEIIAADVDQFTKGNSFIYEELDASDPVKAFHGDFIIRLLATAYLPSISGHVHVNELETKDLVYCGIKGILGLCSAAVFFFSTPVPVFTDIFLFSQRPSAGYDSSPLSGGRVLRRAKRRRVHLPHLTNKQARRQLASTPFLTSIGEMLREGSPVQQSAALTPS